MTPQTRAARNRIARFLDLDDPGTTPDAVVDEFTFAGERIELRHADLRRVLAALDQQPDRIIQFSHDMSGEDVERFRAEWDAARGPERALTVSLDNRTATFRAKPWPAGPPDAAQLDYRAARRQQHPTDPQTSDE